MMIGDTGTTVTAATEAAKANKRTETATAVVTATTTSTTTTPAAAAAATTTKTSATTAETITATALKAGTSTTVTAVVAATVAAAKTSTSQKFQTFYEHTNSIRYKVHHLLHCKCKRLMNYLYNTTTTVTPGIDKLIVVSADDAQTITSHYICSSTCSNLLEMENMLRSEIFTNGIEKTNIKVSCSECILSSIPNGFAFIMSRNKNRIEEMIKNAEEKKNEKELLDAVHHDHATFLKCMPYAELRRIKYWPHLFFNGLVKDKQDVYVNDWAHTWKDGPHLKEMMDLISKHNHWNSCERKYVMIMFEYKKGEKEKINYWTLDIPGGKRYLGETPMQCAIRETEEETSVELSEKLKTFTYCSGVNMYYIFDPNNQSMMNK